MKKTLVTLVAGAALAGVAQGALAQTFRNEVSLFGSWEDIDQPTKFEQSNLYLRYGRFVSPQFVATLGLQVLVNSKVWALRRVLLPKLWEVSNDIIACAA